MSPTLSQIALAKDDAGLRSRILLAAETAGHSVGVADAQLSRIIAADTTDDGGSPTTIAGAYDYQWAQALRALADGGVPSRAQVTARLAAVGTDPAHITDGTIQRAVDAVMTGD